MDCPNCHSTDFTCVDKEEKRNEQGEGYTIYYYECDHCNHCWEWV